MAGYITLPTVATVAALAPEIAPKIAEVPHRGDAETASHRTHTGLHEIHQALRHRATPHQFAGVNEIRHGKQRKGIHAAEQVLMQRGERHVHEEHQSHGHRGQQHQEYRKTQQQQDDR
ncbi:MAG: hypothetical protein A3H35_21685 [Betaproteobacteria bacterium RIFCSPLOWO2_02_FULL_62_17]|nr:MAG: hypothetical protein A3H35_21685 [Betaproteobacteria bacterium RIFCSPLOWO2_02_FULL_62_17]